MLVRQSTIDRHRLQIQQRIAQLQQRLKVKVPVPQIKNHHQLNQQSIQQKLQQSPQKKYIKKQEIKQQIKQPYINIHNNVQKKLNETKIEKKPSQKQYKYSRSFSLRDDDKIDKTNTRNIKVMGGTVNFDQLNKQNFHQNEKFQIKEPKPYKELKQVSNSRFKYNFELAKPSQQQMHSTLPQAINYDKKASNYKDKTVQSDLSKYFQSYRKQDRQTENRENLFKMITNLLQGQKTLQEQFHRFKQMYEQDITMRVDNSYIIGRKQDEKQTNFQNQQEKFLKAYDLPLQKQKDYSWKNQKTILQNNKLKHEPSFSDLVVVQQENENTIIKKIRQQSAEKNKPIVTFLPFEEDEKSMLQYKNRKSILKNNIGSKDQEINKLDYSKPKANAQQYYKQARQKYLYPYIQKNELPKASKNKKQRGTSLNLTSKSVGVRKVKQDKFNDLLKLLKQQKTNERIKVSQEAQQKIWKQVEDKHRKTISQNKQIYHKNSKFEYEQIIGTCQLKRKLREQLLAKIYQMAQKCTYK